MPGYTLPPDADIDSDDRHEASAQGFVPVGTPQGGKWHYDVRGRRGERKRAHPRDRAAAKPSIREINLRKWATVRIINLLNGFPPEGPPQVHQARPTSAAAKRAVSSPVRTLLSSTPILAGTISPDVGAHRRAA